MCKWRFCTNIQVNLQANALTGTNGCSTMRVYIEKAFYVRIDPCALYCVRALIVVTMSCH